MAQGRREFHGELEAWSVSVLVGHMPFVNARLDPRAINPYRERGSGAGRKAEEVRAFIASMAWAALAPAREGK